MSKTSKTVKKSKKKGGKKSNSEIHAMYCVYNIPNGFDSTISGGSWMIEAT